jgi:cytochrome c oxidase subunit 1
MSSVVIDKDHVADAGHGAAEEPDYLRARKGLMSWLVTVDHKRIGIMYLVAVMSFFLVGGLLALGVRSELLMPKLADGMGTYAAGGEEGFLVSRQVYNRLFTLHGAVMVFLVIIPSIPAALGNFVLPLMLGAKDVAFPKMNLASLYIYVVGSLFLTFSMVANGLDTGWTFYTPYSTSTGNGYSVIAATFGAFVLGFSSIFTGLNFIVTVHKMRAPGLTWDRLPLFVWAIYSTSLIQVLATPVIAITLLLLIMERTMGIGIFDPALGGDPVLFQHFFWFYSHPVVYVMILPGFGVISEMITVHSRKAIFGYKAIAASSVAIAFIGFLVWGHHMFVSGQSALAAAVFSFLTFIVAVPTAIKVFSWVATLYKGSIAYTAPMLYTLAFLFLFSIGGLTGLFLGALSLDVFLHDTYFVVAHFHYVMMGGTIFAFIGGIHHWWPKITGKTYNEKIASVACLLSFTGFNVTFFTQFLMGTHGMPRRYWAYLPEFHSYHVVSTIGSYILAAGLFTTLFCLVQSLLAGKKAPQNPWNGLSLEWQTATPPIEHNFHDTPVVRSGPYEFPEIEKVQA